MLMTESLNLERCPYCSIAKPYLPKVHHLQTGKDNKSGGRFWFIYKCSKCGGVVVASSNAPNQPVSDIFPVVASLSDSIPLKARSFLEQAINSLHAPSGAKMLCASSVDAMLKEKGYKDGSLFTRINLAKENHLITEDMALWAHEVRLEANDERHADEENELPNQEQAERMLEFTKALAEFLFVLPSKVKRGLDEAKVKTTSKESGTQ